LIDVRLVIVTDRQLCADRADLLARLAAVLAEVPAGWAAVQVREKDLGGKELLGLVTDVIAVARPLGAPVLVNDRLDVALAAGADGVHLPEAGIAIGDAFAVAARVHAPLRVGCSRHTVDGVARAAADGADLVMLGPIWPTPGKPDGLGTAPLGAARAAVTEETVLCAIGGIEDAERAHEARAAGAQAVAAIRALWSAPDSGAAARRLLGL
jgi:thiamine-phosphate pyrophosphorylase